MKTRFKTLLSLVALPFMTEALSTDSIAQPAPLIELEDFFKNPEEAGHALSPSGDHILFLKPWESRMNVWVQPTSGGEAQRVTSVTERDIPFAFWANDQVIAFGLDEGGDENFHVFLVPKEGGEAEDITPYEETRASVIDVLERDPEHMLLSHNQRNKQVFDLYRFHIPTRTATPVVENPGNYVGYVADHEGKVRVATANDGVNAQILYRTTEEDPFEVILTTNFTSFTKG